MLEACNGLDSIVAIIKFLLKIVQWAVPLILIVLGTVDLVKAVMAGKEEDIKKNQKVLIKRVIAAVIVFLVPIIVSILMSWIGSDDWRTCWTQTGDDIKSILGGENMGIPE